MIAALNLVIIVFSVFAALGLVCAVRIGRRRDTPADPFATPFGDAPGFTAEQLNAMSRRALQNAAHDPLRRSFITSHSAGLALRPDTGGGAPIIPSGSAAARTFSRTVWPRSVPEGEPVECDGSAWDRLPPAVKAGGSDVAC